MVDKINITGFMTCLICLLTTNTVSAQTMSRYSTNLLQNIAKQINLPDTVNMLPAGIHRDYCTHNGNSVTVITRKNQVEHIGYTVFSLEQREKIPSPIYNFLERYALEMDLPREGKWDMERQMLIDHVTFEKGSLSLLPSLCNDTTLTVSISNHSERAYTVEWRRDSIIVCSVFFPSDYELMHGIDMIEIDSRLQDYIESCDYVDSVSVVPIEKMNKISTSLGDFYILERGMGGIPAIPNNLYYQLVSDTITGTDVLQPLCSIEFPKESVSNLFSSMMIENDYEVEIKLNIYDKNKEKFRVPLKQLVRFCLSNNCRPSFNVENYDSATHQMDAYMILRNSEEAYVHLLWIKMDTSTLTDRKGLINVKLTTYVMTHNIKN